MTTTATDHTVARLAKRLDDLEAELERRDMEQMELEGVVEFLERRNSTTLYVLAWLIGTVWGDTGQGAAMLDHLYDRNRHPAGFRQATFIRWRRPERRWSQFGSRSDLIQLLTDAGVDFNSRDSREWLIRAAWKHRNGDNFPAPVLPGGVGPFSH